MNKKNYSVVNLVAIIVAVMLAAFAIFAEIHALIQAINNYKKSAITLSDLMIYWVRFVTLVFLLTAVLLSSFSDKVFAGLVILFLDFYLIKVAGFFNLLMKGQFKISQHYPMLISVFLAILLAVLIALVFMLKRPALYRLHFVHYLPIIGTSIFFLAYTGAEHALYLSLAMLVAVLTGQKIVSGIIFVSRFTFPIIELIGQVQKQAGVSKVYYIVRWTLAFALLAAAIAYLSYVTTVYFQNRRKERLSRATKREVQASKA